MRITELLQDATIDLGVKVNSKEEAIDHLVDLMVKGGNITDREEYKKGILAREANGTTGIGGGIAIPHSKNKAVTKAGLASMTVPDGVDYEAMDGEPSDVFFMIAAPAEGSDVHLEALSRLSVILMDPVFKDSLLKATSKEEYLALIDKKETEKFPEEAAKEEEKPAVQEEKADDGTIRVLAVTACPTGIAHTFMAAESLENKAKEMGFKLKIHADEMFSLGGAELASRTGCFSADHLLKASDEGIRQMAESSVISTLLPATAFCLKEEYAPARKMIDSGCAVAIASDLNPGSCFTNNIPLLVALGCIYMNMSIEEVITALTINGAAAVDRADQIGSIEEGKKADIIFLKYPSINYMPYHTTINLVETVIKNGETVYHKEW